MEILVILLLILLNGLFAMSEIALSHIGRRSNLEMQARQSSAGARQALKLAPNPDRFLSTVQIGITLIGILTGIYSGDTLAAKFGGELARLGIPLRTATVTAQVTIVIAVTYLTIIFGELVPKRIGMNAAERAAKIVAQPMRLLSVAASPFVWLLSRSTAGVARLLGLQRAEQGHRGGNPFDHPGRRRGRRGAGGRTADHGPRLLAGRPHRGVDHDPPQRTGMDRRGGVRGADPRDGGPSAPQPLPRRRGKSRQTAGRGLPQRPLPAPGRRGIRPAQAGRSGEIPAGFEVYNALEQLRTEQLGYGIICDEFGVTRGIITLRDIFEALVGELPDPREGRTSSGAKAAAVWSTGNARSTTFSTGSVWKTPCPAAPTTPSAA